MHTCVQKSKKVTQEQCSCKVVIEREKFKAVSDTVWVCWKAMIAEKTINEECTNKNYSNDNYRLHFAEQRSLLIYLPLSFNVRDSDCVFNNFVRTGSMSFSCFVVIE